MVGAGLMLEAGGVETEPSASNKYCREGLSCFFFVTDRKLRHYKLQRSCLCRLVAT
jgi:hypothetical protein